MVKLKINQLKIEQIFKKYQTFTAIVPKPSKAWSSNNKFYFLRPLKVNNKNSEQHLHLFTPNYFKKIQIYLFSNSEIEIIKKKQNHTKT